MRPLPPRPRSRPALAPIEPDEEPTPFGGLADVLEPDPDAITSLRHPSARSVASQQVPPLSARHPAASAGAERAPAQIPDFAFADTVFADDEAPPASGPIYVSDDAGNTQCVTPLAFPLPPVAESARASLRLRGWVSRTRHAFRRSREEMRELWAGTAEMVDARSGIGFVGLRRFVALWSFFQWSRSDVTRAAMIGVAVFVTAAAVGASTMDRDGAAANAARGSDEVRPPRTLDQHTGKKIALHIKR